MILSELRASAYKYATLLFAVLAVAAVIGCILFRAHSAVSDLRADDAEQRAAESEGRLAAMKQAIARDDKSSEATNTARSANEASAAATNARLAALEPKAHDRPPVPVVCPEPDPDLVRESEAASGRIRAAEDRLRGLRRPAGEPAR